MLRIEIFYTTLWSYGVKWNKKQQAWKVTVCQGHYGSFKCKLDAVAKVKAVL